MNIKTVFFGVTWTIQPFESSWKMGEVTCALCLSMSVCSFLFVQLIKVVSIIFVVLSGLAWMVDTLPKKNLFSFVSHTKFP